MHQPVQDDIVQNNETPQVRLQNKQNEETHARGNSFEFPASVLFKSILDLYRPGKNSVDDSGPIDV